MNELPARQGLYDPAYEHDACGIGFVAHARGAASHAVVAQALRLLDNLSHRGGAGCRSRSGGGRHQRVGRARRTGRGFVHVRRILSMPGRVAEFARNPRAGRGFVHIGHAARGGWTRRRRDTGRARRGRTETPSGQSNQGSRPCSGNSSRRVAMIDWSTGSAGS